MVRIGPWAWGEVHERQKVMNGTSWGCFWEFGGGGSESFQIHHGSIPGTEGRNSRLSPKLIPPAWKNRVGSAPSLPKNSHFGAGNPQQKVPIPRAAFGECWELWGWEKGIFEQGSRHGSRGRNSFRAGEFSQSRVKNEEFQPDGSVPATLDFKPSEGF